MFPFHIAHGWIIAGCLAAALVLTLILAAFLTPRHWWRRANAGALAILVGGTALFACVFMLAAGVWPARHAPAAVALAAVPAPVPVVYPVRIYRVHDDLNLRAAGGTSAARLAIVPGGASVTTTGKRDGDWWEVTARVDGHPVTGWASSLWLRRDDERTVP